MKIYYPQFCFDCHLSFVSDKRNVGCRKCGQENVINCFSEIMKAIKK